MQHMHASLNCSQRKIYVFFYLAKRSTLKLKYKIWRPCDPNIIKFNTFYKLCLVFTFSAGRYLGIYLPPPGRKHFCRPLPRELTEISTTVYLLWLILGLTASNNVPKAEERNVSGKN